MADDTVSTALRLSLLSNDEELDSSLPPPNSYPSAVSSVCSPNLPPKRKMPSKSKQPKKWNSYYDSAIFAEDNEVQEKVSTALTLSLPVPDDYHDKLKLTLSQPNPYPSVSSDLCPDLPLIKTTPPMSKQAKNNNGSRINTENYYVVVPERQRPPKDNETVSTVLSLSSLYTSYGVSLPDDDQELKLTVLPLNPYPSEPKKAKSYYGSEITDDNGVSEKQWAAKDPAALSRIGERRTKSDADALSRLLVSKEDIMKKKKKYVLACSRNGTVDAMCSPATGRQTLSEGSRLQ